MNCRQSYDRFCGIGPLCIVFFEDGFLFDCYAVGSTMNEQLDASLMIEKGQVVVVDYRLIDQSGDCLEQSDEASPMIYLHGHNNLMPGLEKELQGKQQGDQLAVTLPPEQTYGLRREDAVERIPIKYLIKPGKKLTPGMRVQVNTKQGPRDATLVKAGRFNADVDGNHPFAGKTITFELSVRLIRAANSDELAHGHPNGIDGTSGHHH